MRRFIFASHHKLAYGLKDTVNFLTNSLKEIYDINAYLEDEQKDLETSIQELFSTFDADDEVIVLTDMMGGSVYQKFYPYMSENVHIVCGMNLPMALSLVLAPEEQFSPEFIQEKINECRNQIVYVNQLVNEIDEDDE